MEKLEKNGKNAIKTTGESITKVHPKLGSLKNPPPFSTQSITEVLWSEQLGKDCRENRVKTWLDFGKSV